jgi:hypothetical protein
MKTITVTIEGLKPILLHNPAAMASNKTGKKSIPTPEEEALASCYWDKEKTTLVFPSWNILRAFVTASRAYKDGKRSVTPFICGSVEIDPAMLPFGTRDYEIDTRRAVVQRQGILRSRARIDEWKLSFTLLVSDDIPQNANRMLRAIMEEAGRRIGIGDFRLERGGPFGKFAVTEWTES